MPYFLGLDNGTSGTKALLITAEGTPVASDTQEYPLSTPRPLWAEQDPADWWDAAVKATRDVLEKSGVRAEEIAGVGLSGQMHGSVFLDKDNDVLRPALLWCDQRTQAECDWITAQVGRENLVKYISNPVLTGFTAPKIVWLRNHEPDTYAKVAKVLLPKDYLRFKLTGVHATEVSDASGTALFDVAHRTWSQEVLDAAQIPRPWMPECAESIEITGRVSAEAARATGLKEGDAGGRGGGDQAGARSAAASSRPAWCPASSAPAASSSPTPTRPRPTRSCASTPSATPSPASGIRWASSSRRAAACAGCATPSSSRRASWQEPSATTRTPSWRGVQRTFRQVPRA